MNIGDKILWQNDIYKVKTFNKLIRISDGAEYNSGIKVNDPRSRVYKIAYLLVKLTDL